LKTETTRRTIPSISTEQMIEVDRLMTEVYGIQLIQMMENAGGNLAELSRRMLDGDVHSKHIAVLCGGGNNGGGGMVAARRLHNWGAQVHLHLIDEPSRLNEVPTQQWRILEAMGVENRDEIDLEATDLIIDAMIGYGLAGNPRGVIAEWINKVNASGRPVLALDTPSGLDTTTGLPGQPCVHAYATLTLALPKTGLISAKAAPYIGELYLADISVPPQLYEKLGIEIPAIFIHDTIIKIGKSETYVKEVS
jgi:NAD(P)H-hydrate epimerase